jgi:hypothetical protein
MSEQMALLLTFLPVSRLADGRLEHSLDYRTVTTTAVSNNKQDCYVNTVILCEVPGEQQHCYRPSPTTIITEKRCSLLDQCQVRCCLQATSQAAHRQSL